MPASLSLPPRPCVTCEQVFQPKHHRQLCCSKSCLWKRKNKANWAKPEQRAKRAAYITAHADHYRALAAQSRARHIDKRRATANAAFQTMRLNTPWRSLLASRQTHAKQKGLPFNLTEEWAIARWTGRCEVTDILFVLGQRGTGPKPFSPSIDKIDPALGYTQENCRFVIHAVNALKGTLTDEQMIEIAKAIIRKCSMD